MGYRNSLPLDNHPLLRIQFPNTKLALKDALYHWLKINIFNILYIYGIFTHTHTIHVWYIYPDLLDIYGKRR